MGTHASGPLRLARRGGGGEIRYCRSLFRPTPPIKWRRTPYLQIFAQRQVKQR